MAEWVGGLLAILVLAAYPASFYAWFRLWRRRVSDPRKPALLPVTPREFPFWTLADVLVMIGMFMIVGGILSGIAGRNGWLQPRVVTNEQASNEQPAKAESANELPPNELLTNGRAEGDAVSAAREGAEREGAERADRELSFSAIVIHSATSLFVCLAVVGLLWFRSEQSLRGLGLVPEWQHIRLGAFAALLLLPPVTLIMRAATTLVEYEHPVLAELESSPAWPVVVALFVSSVLIAPLTEEFAFRVMLQGSLQRLADPPLGSDRALENEGERESEANWTPRSYWPILVSSVLFALLHFGQGPAPIPLFVLALGLGYLYRQTGSMVPPLIVHLILNGVTMTATVLQLMS